MKISIDIGTSYSTASVLEKNGNVKQVDLNTGISQYGGKYAIPTAVFVSDDGEVVVGQAAMNKRVFNPGNFKMEFKRDIGQNVPYILGGKKFLPEELYTEMFLHIKKRAESFMSEEIEKAYITYPATFTESKKQKVIKAAEQAGIFNIQLIDEPTAAAMCYCEEGKIKAGQNLLIYDFGGGTFDVSVVRFDSDGFKLLTEAGGLSQCGGIDIDRAIFRDMYSLVSDKVSAFTDPVQKMRFDASLSEKAIMAKHQLSESEVFEDIISIGFDTIEYNLTRDKLNGMIAKLIADTFKACEKAISDAGLEKDMISAVLMVGGSSRIPLVHTMAAQFASNIPVLFCTDIDTAVVRGGLEYDKFLSRESGTKAEDTTSVEEKTVAEESGEVSTQEHGASEFKEPEEPVNELGTEAMPESEAKIERLYRMMLETKKASDNKIKVSESNFGEFIDFVKKYIADSGIKRVLSETGDINSFMKNLAIPSGEEVLLQNDTTTLRRSGKNGFAVCKGGFYVKEIIGKPNAVVSWKRFCSSSLIHTDVGQKWQICCDDSCIALHFGLKKDFEELKSFFEGLHKVLKDRYTFE